MLPKPIHQRFVKKGKRLVLPSDASRWLRKNNSTPDGLQVEKNETTQYYTDSEFFSKKFRASSSVNEDELELGATNKR